MPGRACLLRKGCEELSGAFAVTCEDLSLDHVGLPLKCSRRSVAALRIEPRELQTMGDRLGRVAFREGSQHECGKRIRNAGLRSDADREVERLGSKPSAFCHVALTPGQSG